MKKQTVMWTALPNGVAKGQLKLSVFVSPRLQTDEGLPMPQLSQFPDFVNWAGKSTSFAVQFEGGPKLAAKLVGPAPEPALWQALFKSTTYVRPFQFPKVDTILVKSYPVNHIMNFLQTQYQKVGVLSPTALPPVQMLAARDAFGQIAFDPELGTTRIAAALGDLAPIQITPQVQLNLINQLTQTLKQFKAVPPAPAADPPKDFLQVQMFHTPVQAKAVPLAIPQVDFHQVVAALGQFPELLRRLGLVFDLEVPLAAGIPPVGSVQVLPTWSPGLAGSADTTPFTRYTLTASTFLAQPKEAEHKNGMLLLNDTKTFGLVQVDVDSAATRALDLANVVVRQLAVALTSRTTETAGMPPMRSTGISVVRVGRAYKLVKTLEAVAKLNKTAEDKAKVVLYAEDLVRGYRLDVWDARTSRWYSLCRRVGRYFFKDTNTTREYEDEGFVASGLTQPADESTTDANLHEALFQWTGWSLCAPRPGKTITTTGTVAKVENKAATPFGLETAFKPAPKSLPRLRYGATYRLRARAVDLAGNSVPFVAESADFTTAAGPITYSRFEPLTSPNLVPRAAPGPGESLERMVIRSNYNTASTEASERHVAPPMTSQLMAETHGMFDTTAGLSQAAYTTITANDGTFASSGAEGVTPRPEAQLDLPYLPDPLARGAALVGLPGTAPTQVTQVDFDNPWPGKNWPEARPFRIKIVEGTGSPAWDAASRVLAVQVPKAGIVRVPVSTYLSREDLDLMGIWDWLKKAGKTAAQVDELRKLATQGRHWMLTPARELVLVHAVQQPLTPPDFKSLQAGKRLGDTYATLQDLMPISGPSTAKVDVLAEWDEPVDPLPKPKWETIKGRGHAFAVPVEYTTKDLAIRQRHEFNDTRYRQVRYLAVATTRFKEYFPEGTMPLTRESTKWTTVDILNSARPAAPKVLYVVPTFGWETAKSSSGVTRKRTGGGLRVYLDRPWFSSGDGELLGAIVWPSPATPQRSGASPVTPTVTPPPGVLSLVATIATEVPNDLRPYVTQWGMDPIWLTRPTYAVQTLQNFKQATVLGTGLTLEERPDRPVAVAGHPVAYDEERRLWYCDLEVDAGGSYWPFVRLALARYQPKSVTGAHLSRVVLADFAQLAPERVVTLTYDPANAAQVRVAVSGLTHTASAASRTGGELEVTVEARRPDVEGDLGWVPASNSVFALQLQAARTLDTGSVWAGAVTLPNPRGSQPFRLVIREYERFAADSGAARTPDFKTTRRLVFADVLEI